jgi:hypothetical protein
MANFSDALLAVQDGAKIQRVGWNGKGMWVRRIDLYSDKEFRVREINPCVGTFMPFFVIFSHGQLNTWVPSVSDLQADDWIIIND